MEKKTICPSNVGYKFDTAQHDSAIEYEVKFTRKKRKLVIGGFNPENVVIIYWARPLLMEKHLFEITDVPPTHRQ